MRILPEKSVGLIVDVQERLFPHMHEAEALQRRLLVLIRGLRLLGLPLLVTQQYTRGLGPTIPGVREALGWAPLKGGLQQAPQPGQPRQSQERRSEEPRQPQEPPAGSLLPPTASPPYIEKRTFSCCDEPAFEKALAALERPRVIVAGIEAHVCVLQTVADLAARGYTPVVVEDCISSRRASDRDTALRRFHVEGALPASCESILFELARTSAAETFKVLSQLVK